MHSKGPLLENHPDTFALTFGDGSQGIGRPLAKRALKIRELHDGYRRNFGTAGR
jgi:hypothetical protein